MADRRRANRFFLPERVHGSLRVMEDVYIDRVSSVEITIVVARVPGPDEDLLLDLVPNGGRRRVLRVRALRSVPLGVGDGSRYRVTLVPADGRLFALDTKNGISRTPSSFGIAVLVRRIPMSVAEVSSRGCLIESAHLLPEGTVGVLELTMPEGKSAERLRICRMVKIVGGVLPYAAGAEFLPLEPPAAASVRNLIARLEMVLELDSQAAVTLTDGDRSGRHQPAGTDRSGRLQPAGTDRSGRHQPAGTDRSGRHQPAGTDRSGRLQPAQERDQD